MKSLWLERGNFDISPKPLIAVPWLYTYNTAVPCCNAQVIYLSIMPTYSLAAMPCSCTTYDTAVPWYNIHFVYYLHYLIPLLQCPVYILLIILQACHSALYTYLSINCMLPPLVPNTLFIHARHILICFHFVSFLYTQISISVYLLTHTIWKMWVCEFLFLFPSCHRFQGK